MQSDDQGRNWQPKTGWASSNAWDYKKMLRFIMKFLILCPNHNTYLDYISIHLKILFLANIKPGPSIQYCFVSYQVLPRNGQVAAPDRHQN